MLSTFFGSTNVSLRASRGEERTEPRLCTMQLRRGAARPRKSQRGSDNVPMRAVSVMASEPTTIKWTPTAVELVQPIDPPQPKPLEKVFLVLQQLRLLGYI